MFLRKALPLEREMMAGAGAGFCQIVITTPMELLKIQMQDAGRVAAAAKAAGKTVPKISATSLTLELLKTKGILGLYRGTTATMLRDVSFSVVYFPLFARLNALGPRKSDGSGNFFRYLIQGYATDIRYLDFRFMLDMVHPSVSVCKLLSSLKCCPCQ